MGGATVEKPGMNLATRSEGIPQRSKSDSVCRTHESGEREILQRTFKMRCPWARPNRNHTESAMSEATIATRSTCHAEKSRSIDRAPATTRTGIDGIGAPSCSSRTTTKTSGSPYVMTYWVSAAMALDHRRALGPASALRLTVDVS